MRVDLNGNRVEVAEGMRLIDLVRSHLGGAASSDGDRASETPIAPGVAVAVNSEVVPKSRWSETVLKSGDRIEIVGASQGG